METYTVLDGFMGWEVAPAQGPSSLRSLVRAATSAVLVLVRFGVVAPAWEVPSLRSPTWAATTAVLVTLCQAMTRIPPRSGGHARSTTISKGVRTITVVTIQ